MTHQNPTEEQKAKWAANKAEDERRESLETPLANQMAEWCHAHKLEPTEAASIHGQPYGGHGGMAFEVTYEGQKFFVTVELNS